MQSLGEMERLCYDMILEIKEKEESEKGTREHRSTLEKRLIEAGEEIKEHSLRRRIDSTPKWKRGLWWSDGGQSLFASFFLTVFRNGGHLRDCAYFLLHSSSDSLEARYTSTIRPLICRIKI